MNLLKLLIIILDLSILVDWTLDKFFKNEITTLQTVLFIIIVLFLNIALWGLLA